MEAIGPILVLVSIPLVFGWIPRNRLFGFRVPATLRHDAIWYEVNARSARHVLLLGVAMVLLEFASPPTLRVGMLRAVAIVGLAVVTVVDWRYANRLARQLDV